jgi:hypothetical protein
MRDRDAPPAYVGHLRPTPLVEEPPRPGQGPLVMAALAIGFLLLGIQLWLLTVALELFLGGHGRQVWQLALASGAIFLGGLGMLHLVARRPRVRRAAPTDGAPGRG